MSESHKAFEQGQRWARKHGNTQVHARRDMTTDLGITLLIDGWTDCPITPGSVGAELFGNPAMFPADATEEYLREFVRGVLIG